MRSRSRAEIIAAIAGFILPLQTVWIFRAGMLGGVPWSLATIGLYAGDIVLLAAAVFGFARRWRTDRRRLVVAFVVLVAAAFVNVYVSADPWLSAIGWLRIILFVIVMAGLPYGRETMRAFLGGFTVAMFVQAILGIAQFFTQSIPASTIFGISSHAAWVHGDAVVEALGGRWLRAYGGFPHPNIFGVALLVALITATILHQEVQSNQRRRITLIFTFVIFNFALFLTFSRAAVLGLIILLVVLIMYRATRKLAYVGVFTAVAVILVTWPFWGGRMTGAGQLEERSTSERVDAFRVSDLLLADQLLFGVGLHAMPQAIIMNDPARDPYTAQPVHNAPILAFVELGLVGIALLFIVTWLLFRYSTFNIQHSTLLVLLPSLLFDHALWSIPVGIMLIFVLFLTVQQKNPTLVGSS